MSLHVVLYQPEIPANTGNIGRTCLATDTTLHLIHPLGFSTEDKMLRRAGLDYWQHLDVVEHQSIDELYEAYPEAELSILKTSEQSIIPTMISVSQIKIISLFLVKNYKCPKK